MIRFVGVVLVALAVVLEGAGAIDEGSGSGGGRWVLFEGAGTCDFVTSFGRLVGGGTFVSIGLP